MKPITIQRDGKSFTIANEIERDSLLAELINEQTESGRSFSDAWGLIESTHPQLFAGQRHPPIKMPVKPKPPTFFNTGPAPVFGPQLKTLFRLPLEAAQPVCSTAWRANGGTAVSIDFRKVFDGLARWIGQERGLSREAAANTARVQFRQLWEAVQIAEEVS